MSGFGSGGFGFGSGGGGASFGSSNNNNATNTGGFGSGGNMGSNTFGGGQQQQGSSSSTPMFGSSQNIMTNTPAGGGAFGGGFSGNNQNYGNTPTNSGFGASSFGTTNPNPPSTPFGGANPGGFGSIASSPAPSNPFGGNNNPGNTGLTFGSSSNVSTNKNNRSAFNSTPPPTSGWGTPAPAPASSNNPFGSSTNSQFSNHQQKRRQQQNKPPPDNKQMSDGFGQTTSKQPSFSQPSFSQPNNPFGVTSNNSPKVTQVSFSSSPQQNVSDEERRLKEKMEEKKKLQAKIEEKKKKLLEKAEQARMEEKKKKLMERAERFKQQNKTSSLNAEAPAFVPVSGSGASESTNRKVVSRPSEEVTMNKRKDGREELKNAVSLVGTCQYMCPDDELIRRESESDIQILEIPKPGVLHPRDWTLRDTVVKRFRRSAADYKLDVPEWVRPPDVLEKVCAYLEEWVMDRDRQGPDPRFPQNQAPQPLDVYQFIWNRTRMVRKDFTLQNYVGTGGNCDSRAVRCHERIARWHALSEHQLSHIPDFTTMQSQQNIQELGQTLKTLNQFYDDAMNRSLVEVPDKNGKETRVDMMQFSHGCTVDKVQGNNPIDYDGSTLNNEASGAAVNKRLVGKHSVGHSYHGTAEPEMRGLYILLTVNNDGGMEVQKYAARLFKERPAVYASRPVQLALSIYKAKKEYNYARFFQILRSPSTPYLFCCIMFKYVELMRKVAIRIMSRTYGTRKKDGEAIYDSYQLEHLRQLLCFEDLDEARTACKHYNITVKPMKVPSSSDPSGYKVVEYIFWKKSNFSEPVHPEKGYNIPLQPKKMLRTIESKINGATRLGICRGEVSGEGAALSGQQPLGEVSEQEKVQRELLEEEARKKELEHRLKLQQQKLEREKKEAETRRLAELREKRKEAERIEREKEELKMKERQEAEALKLREMEAAKKLKEKQAREEVERKRRELEEREARKKKELEELRRKEQERLERERRLLAEKQRQIEMERERKRREAEAAEQERLRRELEAKRLKEEEEQRRREAEERRIKKEWEDRVNVARKKLLFRRWRRRVSRGLELAHRSQTHLQNIDPTFSRDSLRLGLEEAMTERVHLASLKGTLQVLTPRRILENLLKPDSIKKLSLSDLALTEIESLPHFQRMLKQGSADSKVTLLLKLGVVMASDAGPGSMPALVRLWIDTCLDSYKVLLANNGLTCEVRSVVVAAKDTSSCKDCDVVLFVIPPGSLESMTSSPPSNCVVLSLDCEKARSAFQANFSEDIPFVCASSVSADSYLAALETACTKVAQIFVRETCVKIDRIPLFQMATTAVLQSIWMPLLRDQNDEETILERSRSAIFALADELKKQFNVNQEIWSSWPPLEFEGGDNAVEGYFSENTNLPMDWLACLETNRIQDEINLLLQSFNGTFSNVIQGFLTGAPRYLQDDCTTMISKWQFRRCLEKAIIWRRDHAVDAILFIPNGLLDIVMDGVTHSLQNQQDLEFISTGEEVVMIESDRTNEFALDLMSKTVDSTELVVHQDSMIVEKDTVEFSGVDVSNKRKQPEMNSHESQWVVDTPQEKKRRANPSSELRESSAFTDRLEALLHGETIDLDVGKDFRLSSLLGNATDITLPRSLQ